ncbi:MAG TPA: CocE/NonD family hydrolase [Solirubrobacterales bacterium]|nr:CocE/NonD family hydrolase [Solirubrobacterales bacterium]
MRVGGALGALLIALALAGPVAAASGAQAVDAHGSVEQVYATGLKPGAKVTLLDRQGREVAAKQADQQGGVLFRQVKPGKGYRVQLGAHGKRSAPQRVLTTRPAPPSTAVYEQSIPASGYGYLTTRDGTKLAIDVHPPQDVATVAPGLAPPPSSGPTPTLIEYSGYGYANPAGPESGLAILANLMGFTVVDVNMRGTGCSGGAFDFFEPLQSFDGYDVIETIARQPWVANHQVGMMGISYGGITQLFTAATRPPSLAAIAPLSVFDAPQTTLYPGGILNTGFAVPWAEERVHDAKPASPSQGQAWAYKRIQEGDVTCKENQALHGQAANLLAQIKANSHYRPQVADPLSPVTFVHKIDVPTFLACQWTDEQTGGHCPALAARFTGTSRKWFTFTNGTHIDALDPATFNRWYDFLSLYVARQPPILHAAEIQTGAPLIYAEAMGIGGVKLPPDPVQQQPTYEGALAAFEAQPPVHVLFDNGAGGSSPGQPYAGFEQSFAGLPVPGTEARSWFLAPGGALATTRPRGRHADWFKWNARALPKTDFHGDPGSGSSGLWTATPAYEWAQSPPGSAVSYLSEPLAASTTVIGAGAVKVWVRSSAPSVDLQATISEVRPDGIETFVQNGWKRAEGKLDPDRFVPVTIPLYYQGHAYRAGSRIRVTIAAPNGTQPVWSFAQTLPKGTTKVAIANGRKTPSKLLLPVVPGVQVPTPLPPCPGLRGEPCRPYQPLVNRPAR